MKALQNSMMLTPCGPKAVPTGGAGVALPAGICSLTEPVTFFAISFLKMRARRADAKSFPPAGNPAPPASPGQKWSPCTRSVFRSGLTSSTLPEKFVNGPSTMRTVSFFSKVTLDADARRRSPAGRESRSLRPAVRGTGLCRRPQSPLRAACPSPDATSPRPFPSPPAHSRDTAAA